MIEIAQVHDYGFPIVDFKFQNRGRATAFLHRFTVRVLSARIDPTPVLSHFVLLTGERRNPRAGRLALITRNDGWGDALNCTIRINNNPLAELFSSEARTFRGKIPEGEKIETIILNPATMDANRFGQLLQAYNASRAQTSSRYPGLLGTNRNDAIRLPLPSVLSEFRDVADSLHATEAEAINDRLDGTFGESLWLSEAKFFWEVDWIMFGQHTPSSRYYVSIDPEAQRKEKIYSISHSVNSGQVERFQLALGAPKSCYVRLKFAFHVDGERVLESDEFDVHIWVPRHSASHRGYYQYEDGDELLSLAAERAAKPHVASEKDKEDDLEERYISRRLKDFPRSGFPFLNFENEDSNS
jgi:hypothetical protein